MEDGELIGLVLQGYCLEGYTTHEIAAHAASLHALIFVGRNSRAKEIEKSQ
jgi:hypothetical protein